MQLYVRKVQEVRISLLLSATDFTVSCWPQCKFSWWRKDPYTPHFQSLLLCFSTWWYWNICKHCERVRWYLLSMKWVFFYFIPQWTHYLGVCWLLVSLTVWQWVPSLTLKQQPDCVGTSSCCTVRSLHAWIHTLESPGEVTVYTTSQGMKDDL